MTPLARHICAGLICAAATLATLALALVSFDVSGAIVASGEVRTTLTRQPIQHTTGGKVVRSFVTDGQPVVAGQALLQLARPEIDAEILRLSRRATIMQIEMARLRAERDDHAAIDLPPALTSKIGGDAELTQALATHTALLAERRALEHAFDQSVTTAQLQLDAELTGLQAQLDAAKRQMDLTREQAAIREGLAKQGLARASEMAEFERELATLQARIAQLQTQQAQTSQQGTNIQIERLSARTAAREAAIAALATLSRDHLALTDRLAELQHEQRATVLRAPFDGWVSDTIALSPGAILGASQTALVVIPKDQNRIILARITPQFARQIEAEHPVWFRLAGPSGQNQQPLTGRVLHLSADAIYSDTGAEPHFLATITTPSNHPDLVPGTPAEVFFATPPRNVWAYLSDPLRHYFARALRET